MVKTIRLHNTNLYDDGSDIINRSYKDFSKYDNSEEKSRELQKYSPFSCKFSSNKRIIILVSTLDGYLTALDAANGNQLWHINTDSKPMLSSSIDNIDNVYDGMLSKIIPSLDGGLYQFKNEKVEAMPTAADVLLTSSFSFNDGSAIVGASEIDIYGINVTSGKVNYVCSKDSCQYFKKEDSMKDDVIVLKKSIKTVRAVEIKSGAERWNFSVGQHDVIYSSHTEKNEQCPEHIDETVSVESTELMLDTLCNKATDHNDKRLEMNHLFCHKTFLQHDLYVLPVLSSHQLIAFSNNKPSNIYWTHQMNSPIASAWFLNDNDLVKLPLFDDQNIGDTELNEILSQHFEPLLYVGVYQNQYYVQPAVYGTREVDNMVYGNEKSVAVKSVHWKPYLATDGGYQLQLDYNPVKLFVNRNPHNSNMTSFEKVMFVFFSSLKVCVVSLVCVTLAVKLWKSYNTSLPLNTSQHSFCDKTITTTTTTTSDKQQQGNVYQSRYLTDFTHEHCLGRGGFGVVFQSRNLLDGCSYAVKRISIPDSERAREKVMREVKALAKLDHPGIVRYYQSWMEKPPAGWQEQQDQVMTSDDLTASSNQMSCSAVSSTNQDSLKVIFERESITSGPRYNISSDIDIVFEHGSSAVVSSEMTTTRSLSSSSLSRDVDNNRTEDKLYIYIQMQLCQRENLKDWLCKHQTDRDRVYLLDMFTQICTAISYVHREQLIHRDLKPSNIFFALDGAVKIGDFGLVTATQSSDNINSVSKTMSLHTDQVGTSLYMSPEQLKSNSYTHKVDIYALGLIFFELFNSFNTQMERVVTLQNVRKLVFPEKFEEMFEPEYNFVQPLLSHDANLRPDAEEILQHSIIASNKCGVIKQLK